MSTDDTSTGVEFFLEFLEIAFHNILYYRRLYPSSVFSLKKRYGIPIHISVHPKLNEYITSCLKTVRHLIKDNCVQFVNLVLHDESKTVYFEKYKFRLVNIGDIDVSDPYYVRCEEVFRNVLLKTAVRDSELSSLPDDTTFSIEIVTNERDSIRLNDNINLSNFPWIEADTNFESNGKILPVKVVNMEGLSFEFHVEELANQKSIAIQ